MDFTDLDNTQLINLHEALKELHTGSCDKAFFLGDALRTINSANAVILRDQRINDMLWELYVESYNELCGRFSKQIKAK